MATSMSALSFQAADRFLGDIKLPCLVAKIRNSQLPRIATVHIAELGSDRECSVFLRGKDNQVSDWQKQVLDRLFEGDGLAVAVSEGMGEYERAVEDCYCDLEGRERDVLQAYGILPFLTVSDVVVDDVMHIALIRVHTTYIGNLDEHGVTIYLKEGRWRFDDATYTINYRYDVTKQLPSK